MTTTRTTRIPNAHAGQGAVAQHDGSLPVYRCNRCGGEVVWATSSKTGRKYLADVYRGAHDQRFYIGRNVHTDERCAERVARGEASVAASVEAARNAAQAREALDRFFEVKARHAAGEIDDDELQRLAVELLRVE